jgi:hypothetical protein
MADQQELVSFQRHRDLVSGLTFSRDGRLLVSTGGLVARLWQAAARDAASDR